MAAKSNAIRYAASVSQVLISEGGSAPCLSDVRGKAKFELKEAI